jgi:phenylpyruvate tautomerase PptA (4-oxalocrotonate tautomerase family)
VKEKSFYKKKDIYLNDVKEVKKAIDLELSEAIRLKSKQTHTRKKEHLIKEYTKTLKDVLGKKIVAAFNVDYDESDTYLVIEE